MKRICKFWSKFFQSPPTNKNILIPLLKNSAENGEQLHGIQNLITVQIELIVSRCSEEIEKTTNFKHFSKKCYP